MSGWIVSDSIRLKVLKGLWFYLTDEYVAHHTKSNEYAMNTAAHMYWDLYNELNREG